MSEQVIICPQCQNKIPLTEAISHQIREQLESEFSAKSKKKETELLEKQKQLTAQAKALEEQKSNLQEEIDKKVLAEKKLIQIQAEEKIREQLAVEYKDMQDQIKEKDAKIQASMKQEIELRKQKRELEDAKLNLESEITRKVEEEKNKIVLETRTKMQQEQSLQLKDMQEQIAEKESKITEFQKMEMDLRKQKREIEESKKSMELEMQRTLDEQRTKIAQEIYSSTQEEWKLKEKEKDKKIEDMLKQIDELKQKAEQGSQKQQGEIYEIELEEVLINQFKLDTIVPVASGKRGADIIQTVHNAQGMACGTIIWEVKRTRNWSDGWIEKLKDDQREAKADIAVILTTVLPKEIEHFGYQQGVWITDFESMMGLATALRFNITQLYQARQSAVGKNDKMEMMYAYLSGPEFRQRVEGIVNGFVALKDDLEKEKRAMLKIWAKREKQIERVMHNTTAMYGDMQGIVGASLPELKKLQLESGDETDNLLELDEEK